MSRSRNIVSRRQEFLANRFLLERIDRTASLEARISRDRDEGEEDEVERVFKLGSVEAERVFRLGSVERVFRLGSVEAERVFSLGRIEAERVP